MAVISCPQCGAQIPVHEGQAGTTISCPSCQAQVTAPAVGRSAGAPPPLVPPPPDSGPSPAASRKAVTSLVLGVLSVVGCTAITGIPGIIYGHMAMSEIGRRRGEVGGSGLAITGLVLSYTGTVLVLVYFGILAAILLPALVRAREAARRASCQNNMKQIALVLKMFANEQPGLYYPALASNPARLMFEPGDISPEFFNDTTVFVCPSHPDASYWLDLASPEERVDSHSYFYLGYAVTNEEEVKAFAEAFLTRIAAGLPFDEDLAVSPGIGSGGGDALLRLREGVHHDLAAPGQTALEVDAILSNIPVLIEPPGSHHPPGGNVLFMDGSVRFMHYPGEWPMTESTINTLARLEGR